jgi:hypothetical protein
MMGSVPHSNATHQWACLVDARHIYVYSTNREHQITRISLNISNHGDIVGTYVFLLVLNVKDNDLHIRVLNFVHILRRK